MKRLQGIHENAGDIAPRPQDMQRPLRHVGEGIGFVRGNRIAHTWLHVTPPAMIGTCEANQMRSARMIAGKPHRLHHSFGTGHVERDFVETGNLAEPANIVRNHRMVGAEHRSQRVGALFCLGNAILVKIVAEDIDAVGAGQVVEDIAVEVGDGDAAEDCMKALVERCSRTIRLY